MHTYTTDQTFRVRFFFLRINTFIQQGRIKWFKSDTEDWSNDAENTALITEINYSLTHILIENSYFKL